MADNQHEDGARTPTPVMIDARVEFISMIVKQSLKLKSERWKKFIATEEANRVINSFLDNDEPPLIVFCQIGPSVYVSNSPFQSNAPASGSRNKFVYFIKKLSKPIQPFEIEKSLLFGDISIEPLEQIMTFLDEVSQG